MNEKKTATYLKRLTDFTQGDDFIIVEEFPEIDYVLIYRGTRYEPWVAAWAYNKEGKYWGQGHYFSDIRDAMAWIEEKYNDLAEAI